MDACNAFSPRVISRFFLRRPGNARRPTYRNSIKYVTSELFCNPLVGVSFAEARHKFVLKSCESFRKKVRIFYLHFHNDMD